jgi:hypothetical protein
VPIITPSGGGGGGTLSTVVNITAAQVKALHTTGVQLVAAPGAGNVLLPLAIFVELIFGTLAYVDPGGADVEVATSTAPAASSFSLWNISATGLFTAVTIAYWYAGVPIQNSVLGEAVPGLVNTPIGLVNFGPDLTAGNSPLRITTYYAVVPV